MKDTKKYSLDSFDIDALASLSKLSLREDEAKSFLADVCDMANYTYETLKSGSADGALAVCAIEAKTLSELREDECCRSSADIMSGVCESADGYVVVPRTVGGSE